VRNGLSEPGGPLIPNKNGEFSVVVVLDESFSLRRLRPVLESDGLKVEGTNAILIAAV
jgi:hypothetical protein